MKKKFHSAIFFLFVTLMLSFTPQLSGLHFGDEDINTVYAFDSENTQYQYAYGYYGDYDTDYYFYDSDSGPYRDNSLSPLWIVGSIVFGLVVAWAVTSSMKRQLKSVEAKAAASDYIREGSLKLSDKNDMFLYRHVTTTPRADAQVERQMRQGGHKGGHRRF